MARESNRLTALKIRQCREPGRYSDGDGLYLYVQANGNRSWVFRWRDRVTGKLRDKGLGPERVVTLAQARERASACRDQVWNGGDPIAAVRDKREAQRLAHAKRTTFAECCAAYIDSHRAGWRNEKHADQWTSTLGTYAAPLYPLNVGDIDTGLVVKCLEPIWKTKTETARRVRARMEMVLDWATVRGYRMGDNPARWKGNLEHLFPKAGKVAKKRNQPALPFDHMHRFMVALRARPGAARMLEFAILCASRPGEVRGARWDEFDLEAGTWTIPAERMKAHREHVVPLSDAAVKLIKAQPHFRGSDYVFAAPRGGMYSDATMTKVVKDMHAADLAAGNAGFTDPKQRDTDGNPMVAVAHGFRSTFRDWAAERTSYPRDVAEMALAHAIGDKVEAAYRRGDLFTKRTRLMADWAKFIDTPPAKGGVTPIRRKAG